MYPIQSSKPLFSCTKRKTVHKCRYAPKLAQEIRIEVQQVLRTKENSKHCPKTWTSFWLNAAIPMEGVFPWKTRSRRVKVQKQIQDGVKMLTSNDRLVNGNTQMDERKQNVQCNSELENSKMKRRSSCSGQTHKRRYQKLRKINANFNQHENPAMMIYSSKRNVDLCELVAKYSHIF